MIYIWISKSPLILLLPGWMEQILTGEQKDSSIPQNLYLITGKYGIGIGNCCATGFGA
jgi:hypothetical protein